MDNENSKNTSTDNSVNRRVESAHIEQSQHSLTEELSLKNITQILLQNWALFTLLFIAFAAVSIATYSLKVPFQSVASVIINDNKNSSLQFFTAQFSGHANAARVNEAKKSNSSVQKSIEYLKTTDFYTQLMKSMASPSDLTKMTIAEKNGFDRFKSDILNSKNVSELNADEQIQAVRKMDAMMKLNLRSDYEVELIVSSLDKELAYFIAKNAVPVVVKELTKVEADDLKKIKDFLTQQKESLDKSIQDINKQLSDFQSKPENLLSLGTAKVGDYISELMVRKNEIRMKISENNKVVQALSGTLKGRRDSGLYGNSGKIQAIKIENDMLQSKLVDLQRTLDRVTHQAKTIPAASMTYDELKKKSDLEFQNYKQVTEALAKVDANELALNNKFQIIESPRFDQVRPLVGLTTLMLLSLILAQALGSLIIYIRTIWDTTYVTAQQTRNIVIVDGHSLDPRVFIENSKIKFQLKSSAFEKAESNKKLGFDFGHRKAVNGDDLK